MQQVKPVTSSGPQLDAPGLKKLRKLDRVFKGFREVDELMPLAMAHALVVVGMNEGKSLQELGDVSGIGISNLSRYILALSDRTRTGGPGSGLGLVIREQDPMNLRRNSYSLSPKGKLFFQEIVEIL